MEEIKVGEYVRTNDGEIIKVKKFKPVEDEETNEIWYQGESFLGAWESEVIKHSPNIIDLIEVGDYVNGNYVIGTGDRINDYNETVILTENYDEWTNDGIVTNKEIKEVVTHEQFNSIKYML